MNVLSQDRIRVSIVTSSYPVTKDSISGIFIMRLVEKLPANVIAAIITPASDRPIDRENHQREINLTAVRYAPRRWRTLAHKPGGIPSALAHNKLLYLLLPSFLLSLFAACLRASKKTDLFHANWSISGVIAGLTGRITGTPVITTLRGSDVNRASDSWLYRWLLTECVRLSSYVVTVSESLGNALATVAPSIPATKVCVIPNGVDDAFFNIPDRKCDGNQNRLRLVTVCNLIKDKGVDLIITAVSRCNYSGIELEIIGDGPEKTRLEALAASLGLTNRVSFTGIVPPSEMPARLEKSDVFILASYREGRSNAVLEAMAAGMSVIASDIESIRDIVKDSVTGFLFTAGRIDEITSAIDRLQEDPGLRCRMGKAGRSYMLDRHLRWSVAAERYASLYQQVVADYRSVPFGPYSR